MSNQSTTTFSNKSTTQNRNSRKIKEYARKEKGKRQKLTPCEEEGEAEPLGEMAVILVMALARLKWYPDVNLSLKFNFVEETGMAVINDAIFTAAAAAAVEPID